MSGLAAALAFGFLLGVRHAADADHVAAVSAFVARSGGRRRAWLLGASWGIGHSVTVFAAGALILAGRLSISQSTAALFEAAAGAALLVLGVLNMARPARDGAAPAQLLRSAGVGLVHGLAGSAGAALLVLAALPDPRWGALYLALFALGTLCGMLALSAAMEWSFARLAALWLPSAWLTRLTGAFSAGLGAWMLRSHLAS